MRAKRCLTSLGGSLRRASWRDWFVPVTNIFQRERDGDQGTLTSKYASSFHHSTWFFAIQPSALLRLFTSTACTARVFMDASEGHVSSLLSTQYIMMLTKLYSKDSFFPFQFLYRLPHFTFSWLPPYCCNTHPQTACLLLKVVAILGCVAVEYLVACLSDSKEKTSQNMMTSPVLIDISYVENRRTNNILHIMGHIGQITGQLKFVMVTTVSVMERRNSLTLQYFSLN